MSILRAAPALLALLAAAPGLAQSKVQPPPGMVLIPGGTTKIGSTEKEVEAIGLENPNNFHGVMPEIPQHDLRVDDFFLMTNEVTNEQYAAFVRATRHRPPQTWGEKIIDEAGAAFLEEDARKRQEAKQKGELVPERKVFDRSDWWKKNWEGKEWAIPAGKETLPVVYVDYQDAKAYARWAGVRLMTEFEFQRAVRGKTKNLFPWGNEMDDTRAACTGMRINEPLRVASLPQGVSPEGVWDLAGNVWEWTASPFDPYPGYKDLTIEIKEGKKKRKITGTVGWDSNQRVVVSGCFQNSVLVCRATTRRATERNQSTDSMGFRCAASVTPGQDISNTVLSDDLPGSKRPQGIVYDESKAVAADKWIALEGTATAAILDRDNEPELDDQGKIKTGPLPGYGIIGGYEYVLFVPAIDLEVVSAKGLTEKSIQDGVVHLGVFSSTRPLLEPELAAGTYMIAFRGAGDLPEFKPPPAAPGGQQGIQRKQDPTASQEHPHKHLYPEGYDFSTDNLIVYDSEMTPVAVLPAPKFSYVRPVQPEILIGDGVRKIPGVDEDGKPIEVDDPVTFLTFKVNTFVKVSNKGFNYDLQFLLKPGEIDGSYRH